MPLYLVRYGELALKSRRVRARFQDVLVNNIQAQFMARGAQCLTSSTWGRIFVEAPDAGAARDALRHTFGVVSISPCKESTSDLGEISDVAVQLFEKELAMARGADPEGEVSFAVRARRDGDHSYTSQDVGAEVGAAIMARFSDEGVSVDLTIPAIEVFVEVRRNRSYVYTRKEPGPGGMPLGTQGKALALVDRDEAVVAAWLMMKRGCRVTIMCLPGMGDSVRQLQRWDPGLRVHNLGGDRRSDHELFEDLKDLAARTGSQGYVFGSTYADFDTRLRCEFDRPAFYPLVGMDQQWVGELLRTVNS